MVLQLFVLGRFELRRDGVVVTDWPRAGPRRLLKLLAVQPRHALSCEKAAFTLWPDDDDGSRVQQRLHHLVYLLRSTLEPPATRDRRRASCIQVRDGVIQLITGERLWIDAAAFECDLDAALRSPTETASLTSALALYGGSLLGDDTVEDWFATQRAYLDHRWCAGAHALARRSADHGDNEAAISTLQRLVQFAPADESAHRALISLYARRGRLLEVERQYAECTTLLASDLGVAPGAETEAAYVEAKRALAPPQVRFAPPTPLVSLIGRDALVDEVGARLARGARLLTLTGLGGVGKTQLALRVAVQAADTQRHGACVVWLAELDDERFLDGLARALGIALPPGCDAEARITRFLRDKTLLLVLDNFEHLATAAAVLPRLLQAAPGVALLITSRRRLNLATEQLVSVPPLEAGSAIDTPGLDSALSPAVRLFAERARAVTPGFALDATTVPDVQAIVQRLDGLPLAIELAAARLPLFDLHALRQALERNVAVVGGGGADRPLRHRSLDDSLAWSFSLLSQAQQQLLLHLSWCDGAFDADDAAAFDDGPAAGPAGLALQALIELGLVARAPLPQRFCLLDTTREFARTRCAAQARRDDIARRFANHYAGLAEQIDADIANGRTDQAIARFESQRANHFAALDAADAAGDARLVCRLVSHLARCWGRCGVWHRAHRWVERACALAEGLGSAVLPHADRGRLLSHAGSYWKEYACFERAHQLAAGAVASAEAAGDEREIAHACLLLSAAALAVGAHDQALAAVLRARDLAVAMNDERLRWFATNNLGSLYMAAAELDRAQDAFMACDAHLQRQPSPQARVAPVHNLALIAHYRGQTQQAIDYSDQALALERSGPVRASRLALACARRAWMFCCQADAARAEAALHEARRVASGADISAWDSMCAALEGKIAVVRGDHARAVGLLLPSLDPGAAQADQWDLFDTRLWLLHATLWLPAADTLAVRCLDALTATPSLWRQEHPRVLEAAAAWLTARGQGEQAARAWTHAQTQRERASIQRFAAEAPLAARTVAALEVSMPSARGSHAPDANALLWLRKTMAEGLHAAA